MYSCVLCSDLNQIVTYNDDNADDKDSCQYIYWQVKFPFPLWNRDVSLHSSLCWSSIIRYDVECVLKTDRRPS